VKKIRDQYGLSQDKFAILMGRKVPRLLEIGNKAGASRKDQRAYCCKLRQNILMHCLILPVTEKQKREYSQRVAKPDIHLKGTVK